MKDNKDLKKLERRICCVDGQVEDLAALVDQLAEDLAELIESGTGASFEQVTNYAALPAAGSHTGEYFHVLNSQGTSWLPGSLGGTYYSKGFYYSTGTDWVFVGEVPYQASQATVDAGTDNTQFVTASTLAGASKWSTKQDNITLTTSGTSGAATLAAGTLNIPQYQAALTNPVTGTGANGQVTFWTGTNTQSGDSQLFWDNVNKRLGIGHNVPTSLLYIRKDGIGTALDDANGLVLENTSSPGSSQQEYSPGITLIGNASRTGANFRGITKARLIHVSTHSGGGSFYNNLLLQIDSGTGAYANIASFSADSSSANSAANGHLRLGSISSPPGNSLVITGGTQSYGISGTSITASSNTATGTVLAVNRTFAPTSRTEDFNFIFVSGTINQTGTSTSISRGLHILPTLTSAVDWRAIEATGRVLLKGAGATSATTSLQVQNSAASDKFVVKDSGEISLGTDASVTLQSASRIIPNGSLILAIGGGGFFSLHTPDGGTTGGNARGENSVDLCMSRNNAANVASGVRSFNTGRNNRASGAESGTLGGVANVASGVNAVTLGGTGSTASGDYSAVAGQSNTASGTGTFAVGTSCVASQLQSFAGGSFCTASGWRSFAFGQNCVASANYSIANGFSGQSSLYAQRSMSNISTVLSQTSDIRLTAVITGTAKTELFLDGASARAIIPISGLSTNARLWNAKIQIAAICTTQGNGTVTAGEAFIGNYAVGISRIGTTTSLIGTVQNLHTPQTSTNMATAVVDITADDTNEALKIEFTPPTTAGSTTVIRVVATVYLTEVGY